MEWKLKQKLIVACLLAIWVCPADMAAQCKFLMYSNPDSCEVIYTVYPCKYPPDDASMPWYTRNAYAALDSACKTGDYEAIADSIQFLSDDALRLGYFHYLTAFDYNPILMHHYWWHSSYYIGELYQTPPRDALAVMLEQYYARFVSPDTNQQKILDADGGIYVVYVDDVSHRIEAGYYGAESPIEKTEHWCAHGLVESTILGDITNQPDVTFDGQLVHTVRASWDCPTTKPDSAQGSALYNSIRSDFILEGNRYLLLLNAAKVTINENGVAEWRILINRAFKLNQENTLEDPQRFFGGAGTLHIKEAETVLRKWKSSLLPMQK